MDPVAVIVIVVFWGLGVTLNYGTPDRWNPTAWAYFVGLVGISLLLFGNP